MRNGTEVNYSCYGGCGMIPVWLDNHNSDVKDEFRAYYNLAWQEKIDPKTFIVKLYKMLTTKYKFVITFEYLTKNPNAKLKSLCRPSIFIDGEFIIGLDWHANKWHALQQMLIHFGNHEYHKLKYDIKKHEYTKKNISDILTTTDIFEHA